MKPSEKLSAFLNGAGFYIVLFLAIAIIGASGYYVYSTILSTQDRTQPPAQASLSEQGEPHAANGSAEEATVLPPSAQEKTTVPVSGTVQIKAPQKPESSTPAKIVSPLSGETLTAFSMDELIYSETMGDWRTHDGIDIAAEENDAVLSCCDGKVISVINDYWMGTTVTVDCGNGYTLVYASLQSAPPVSVGDHVSAGDPIGYAAAALSEEALGTHLHFSVLKNAVPTDPAAFLKLPAAS